MLEELGWQTRSYHPRALASTDTMAVHKQIHEGSYKLVLCDLPSGLGSVPPNKLNAVLREMALWIRTAKETSDCHGLILGPRSRIWQNPDIHGLLADGIVTEHRHASCRHGVKDPVADKWSPLSVHVFATKRLTDAICQCASSSLHANWDEARPGRMGARRFRQVMVDALYTPVVSTIMKELTKTIPDTADAFPTEARLRAKAREKAGHKAKKRKKFVENTFDDLGDDLKGLGPNLEYHMADYLPLARPTPSPREQSSSHFAQQFLRYGFTGTEDLAKTPSRVFIAKGIQDASQYLGPDTSPAI